MTPEQRERASEAAKLRRRREQVWQPPPCCAQLYTEILGKFGSNRAAEVRRIIEDHPGEMRACEGAGLDFPSLDEISVWGGTYVATFFRRTSTHMPMRGGLCPVEIIFNETRFRAREHVAGSDGHPQPVVLGSWAS
jgi:hypothetical protein